MRHRFPLALLGLVVLLGTTAFAPAPFLKPDRRNGADTELLTRLQGTWRMTAKQVMTPDGLGNMSTRQHVRIEKGQWQFVSTKGPPKGGAGKGGFGGKAGKKGPGVTYRIVLEPGGMPRIFRLKRTNFNDEEYAFGILGFEGTRLRVMYRMNYEDPDIERPAFPPANFQMVPQGWYLLTLEREN